jgi:integrase
MLPLIQQVRDLLESRAVPDDSTLLFRSAHDPHIPVEIRTPWDKAREAAGLPDFRFHDLRHSCASYLAMNGATLLEIADVLGHKTLAMVKRYSHLSTSHKTALIDRVLSKVGEQEQGA